MVSAAEVTDSSGCKDRRKHYGSGASEFPKAQYQAGRPKATDLQDFYTKQLERVKANSVIHALTESAKGEVTSFQFLNLL